MIEILPQSEGNVLGIRATGKVTDEDYEKTFIPALEKLLADHDKVSCLYFMDEAFEGWEIGAMWEDAKFGIKHRNDFDKIAVIGGPKWGQWAVKLEAHFTSCDIKVFEIDQIEEAWKWIK